MHGADGDGRAAKALGFWACHTLSGYSGLLCISPARPRPGQTVLLLRVNSSHDVQFGAVELGAPDSVGPGKRALVVQN